VDEHVVVEIPDPRLLHIISRQNAMEVFTCFMARARTFLRSKSKHTEGGGEANDASEIGE